MAELDHRPDTKKRLSIVETVLEDGTIGTIKELVHEDHSHDIQLRTMTWQRAAWLLAGDQVCLAIMAQTVSTQYRKPLPVSVTSANLLSVTVVVRQP
jgi:hypothetical protein